MLLGFCATSPPRSQRLSYFKQDGDSFLPFIPFYLDFLFPVLCECEGDLEKQSREKPVILLLSCIEWGGDGMSVGHRLNSWQTRWKKVEYIPKYVNSFVFSSSKLPFSLAEMT